MILNEALSYITTKYKCPHCGEVHKNVLVDIKVFQQGMKIKCPACEKEVIIKAAQ